MAVPHHLNFHAATASQAPLEETQQNAAQDAAQNAAPLPACAPGQPSDPKGGGGAASAQTPAGGGWPALLSGGRVGVAAPPQQDALELLCFDTRPLPRAQPAYQGPAPEAVLPSISLLRNAVPHALPREREWERERAGERELGNPDQKVGKEEVGDEAADAENAREVVRIKPYLLGPTRSVAPAAPHRAKAETQATSLPRKATLHRFVCIVVPEFAAWVAGQSQPALKQVPYVVQHRGQVLASSPLALAAGVKTGQSVGRAQARCSQVVVLNRDTAREELAWGEVQRLVYGLTPRLEAVQPGLIFASMDAAAVGQLGPVIKAWRARLGVADDRATAHLAALTAGSGVSRTVGPGRSSSFVRQVPVTALFEAGLHPDIVQRLEWFGWRNVGALRVLTRRQMEEQFGAEGELLWRYAVGVKAQDNQRTVQAWTPPAEVCSRLELALPAREPVEWQGALEEVLMRAAMELGQRRAQSLEVCVTTVLGTFSSRRLLREPAAGMVATSTPTEGGKTEAIKADGDKTAGAKTERRRAREKTLRRFLQPATAALEVALDGHPALQPVVTAFEVRLGALTVPEAQNSLFEGIRCPGERGPALKLLTVIEAMARRFPNSFGRFVPLDPHSPWPEDIWSFEAAHRQLHSGRTTS